MPEVARVYRRDASWFRQGRGGSAFAWHWPKDQREACLTACGRAVCNTDDSDCVTDPAAVPVHCRCMRSGCKQKWQAWDAELVRQSLIEVGYTGD